MLQRHLLTPCVDFKMEITLFDLSTEDDQRDIRLSIFRPPDKMPEVKLADVLLLSSVKVSPFVLTSREWLPPAPVIWLLEPAN